MGFKAEIRIVGDRVEVRNGRQKLVEAPVDRVLEKLARTADWRPGAGVLPPGVRLWHERGDATAIAVEVPPHTRTVRWLADDSEAPFGSRARYRTAFIGFPYVIVLAVFRQGALTGFHQLYYRRSPLGIDEDLLLPNLYNVAEGYGQRCWVCLERLPVDVAELAWPQKIDAILDHVFTAAFNKSSEMHEGNSYWGAMREIDPRVSTIEAWEQATRENALFPLEVNWRPAETTASEELVSMLDRVVAMPRIHNAKDLAGVIAGAIEEGSTP